jgi:hypothetical protein
MIVGRPAEAPSKLGDRNPLSEVSRSKGGDRGRPRPGRFLFTDRHTPLLPVRRRTMSATGSIAGAAATFSALSTRSPSSPTVGTSTASQPAIHLPAGPTTATFRPNPSLQPQNKKGQSSTRNSVTRRQ